MRGSSARADLLGWTCFFVLSGYLITGLLTQEMEGTDGVSLGAFYARRVRRLLPAAFVLVVATAGTAFFLLSPLEQATLSRSVLASSAYLSNVYFYRAGRDYFASGVAANPLLHTWSLAVEEQFYLVWPLLILAVYRLRASRKAMCVAMGSLAVVSFAASIWITRINQPMSFNLTPFRAWEFALGGLASQIPRAWLERRAAVVRAVGWIGLVVVFVSAFATTPQGFPGVKVLLPVLGAAGILVAGAIQDGRGVGRLLRVAPLPFLGQRSYALYLWHWPILIFAGIYRDPLRMRERLLCLAAALAMADLSYRLVEHPIRSSGWVRRRTALCLGSAVALTAVGVAGGLAWRHWAVRTPNYKRFSAVVADLPEDVAQGCLTAYGDSTPRTCAFGSVETPTRTVVLMGDSHMEQWLPRVRSDRPHEGMEDRAAVEGVVSGGRCIGFLPARRVGGQIVCTVEAASAGNDRRAESLGRHSFGGDLVYGGGPRRSEGNYGGVARGGEANVSGDAANGCAGDLASGYAVRGL